MTYEYMTGMGGIVTYPGQRGGDYSPDAAECSSLRCPPGSVRQSFPGITHWITSPKSSEETEQRKQELQRTREQRRNLTERGCVRLCTERSEDVRKGEISTATEHYCCPSDPNSNNQYLQEYIHRLTFKAPYPEGTRCHWDAGYGGRGQAVPQFNGTTRRWKDYFCDPTSGMSCSANLPIPNGCAPTGRWYDLSTKELCCETDSSAPQIREIPLNPQNGQTSVQNQNGQQTNQQAQGFKLWHLLAAGAAGMALIALLKR